MNKVEYKVYKTDEECAWVISECLEGSVVSAGFAFDSNKNSMNIIWINHQGNSYIIPLFLAQSLTYVFVEAVNHKCVDRFTEIFLGLHGVYTTHGFDIGVVDKLMSHARHYIESFREVT